MSYKYILQNGEPVPTDDLQAWSCFMEDGDRVVERTELGDISVSTVFLGLDHSHGGSTPILYETLVFGGECDGLMKRYATRDEAQAGHDETVRWIKIAAR